MFCNSNAGKRGACARTPQNTSNRSAGNREIYDADKLYTHNAGNRDTYHAGNRDTHYALNRYTDYAGHRYTHWNCATWRCYRAENDPLNPTSCARLLTPPFPLTGFTVTTCGAAAHAALPPAPSPIGRARLPHQAVRGRERT